MSAWIRVSMFAAVALAPALAQAQPAPAYPPPPPAPEQGVRQGLTLGFGVGGGHVELDCDDCGDVIEAGSLDFHIGAMLGPRLAILFDGWTMIHQEDFLTATHTIATAAAQYWVTPRLWIKGGLGVAQGRWRWDGIFVEFEDRTEHAPAVMIAGGYELYLSRAGDFAIDVQLRGGTGFYSTDGDDEDYEVSATNAAVQVGFNWY